MRRDLRLDLQFQRGAAKLDARHAIADFRLIRQFRALLDHRLHAIRRDHARTRHDLAAALVFQRAQLDVQQARSLRGE